MDIALHKATTINEGDCGEDREVPSVATPTAGLPEKFYTDSARRASALFSGGACIEGVAGMARALEGRPGAMFDLVAVAPAGGRASGTALAQSQLRKYANDVLVALIDMGLPPSRIFLEATLSP